MHRRSAIVSRGLAYGAAMGAVPYLVFFVPLVTHGALAQKLAILGFGAAMGALPGLAVGAALALSGPALRRASGRARAALAAGGAFFAENLALVLATGGPAWLGLSVVGTPIAAAVGALMSRRIVEPRDNSTFEPA